MRKNLLKKLVAVVATTAVAVTALLAAPQDVKAATDKTIYLEVEEDAEYAVGWWNDGLAGLTTNAELMAGSDWQYVFTKVEAGLYKISVTVDGTVTLPGLQIYKAGEEMAKSDPQWSTDATFCANLTTLLNSDATSIKVSGYSAESWSFMTVAEMEEEPTTAGTTTGTPDTGDSTMLFALVAVAAVASVVVLKKRTVTE